MSRAFATKVVVSLVILIVFILPLNGQVFHLEDYLMFSKNSMNDNDYYLRMKGWKLSYMNTEKLVESVKTFVTTNGTTVIDKTIPLRNVQYIHDENILRMAYDEIRHRQTSVTYEVKDDDAYLTLYRELRLSGYVETENKIESTFMDSRYENSKTNAIFEIRKVFNDDSSINFYIISLIFGDPIPTKLRK